MECAAATLLTLGLAVWILTTSANWPYATAFVSSHLALTIASGGLLIRRERRDTTALCALTAL